MKKTKPLGILLAAGFTASIGPAQEQFSILALDQKYHDTAYVVRSSRTLTDSELLMLKAILKNQDLTLVNSLKNQNSKDFKIDKITNEESQDTLDLINYIRDITGLETKISTVDLRSMLFSTQENISK